MENQILLYEKVLELRSTGLSYGRIIAEIQNLRGVRLTKSCVSYWVNKRHSPLGRAHPFDPVPSPELAYVIGVKFGDGSVSEKLKTYVYAIRLQAKDRDFVEEFDRCVSTILKTSRHRLWRGAGRPEFMVEIGSYLLHRFLQKSLAELRPFIEYDPSCAAAFLRGFFDSECCVSKRGDLTAYNTSLPTLTYAQALLELYWGIQTTGPRLRSRKGSAIVRRGKTYYRNSDCYQIYVRRSGLGKFLRSIGLTISRKLDRLEKFRASG